MTSVISYYFSTLLKHLFVLLFFCSSIPLILFALNYSEMLVLSVLKDMILLSIPWFLWFHQALFCGFTTPRTIPSRLLLIVVSTILSTVLLMITFPYTQKHLDFAITDIQPNVITPKNKIISTDEGTLIIDPQNSPTQQTMFSHTGTKALWISSNYLLFNTIKTNNNSFELSNPESFSSFGYYPQSGSQILPFDQTTPTLPQYKLGQKIIQSWFDNMSVLHKKVQDLYTTAEIELSISTNSLLAEISTIPNKQTIETNDTEYTNSLSSYKKAAISSKKILLAQSKFTKIPKNIQTQIFDYANIFLSILCVFALASLLGVIVTIGQHFLGALIIIMILSIYTPYLSTHVMNISLELNKLHPSSPILLVNFLLVIVLYTCAIIATTIKSITRGAKH